MADWTNIADATLEPGKPIRAIDARALRENPIAIAEGAPGAPRIDGAQGPVIETNAVTNRNLIGLHAARLTDPAIPVLTVTASDDFPIGLAASNVAGTTQTSSSSFVLAWTTTIIRVTGTVRFKAAHYSSVNESGNTATSEMRVLKNGVVINTWTTSSASDVVRSQDIAVVPGDIITWQHRRSSGSVTNLLLFWPRSDTASNGYTTAPLIIAASDL